jgi:hypothetical protein
MIPYNNFQQGFCKTPSHEGFASYYYEDGLRFCTVEEGLSLDNAEEMRRRERPVPTPILSQGQEGI